MSVAAVSWALSANCAELRIAERLVLVALAERANCSHECWPSQALLASELGLSVFTISRCVNGLAAAGYLTISRRRHCANVYQLAVGRAENAPDEIPDLREGATLDDQDLREAASLASKTCATAQARLARGRKETFQRTKKKHAGVCEGGSKPPRNELLRQAYRHFGNLHAAAPRGDAEAAVLFFSNEKNDKAGGNHEVFEKARARIVSVAVGLDRRSKPVEPSKAASKAP